MSIFQRGSAPAAQTSSDPTTNEERLSTLASQIASLAACLGANINDKGEYDPPSLETRIKGLEDQLCEGSELDKALSALRSDVDAAKAAAAAATAETEKLTAEGGTLETLVSRATSSVLSDFGHTPVETHGGNTDSGTQAGGCEIITKKELSQLNGVAWSNAQAKIHDGKLKVVDE